MKKILLPFLLAIAATTASAQHINLNIYSAYVFDDDFSVYNSSTEYAYGKIKGGLQLGAGIEYMPNQLYGVELLYQYKKADAPSTFKFGTLTTEKNESFEVSHHWIMLAGNSHVMSSNQKVEGVGGFMLGMLVSDVSSPSTGNSASNTNFAWGAKLGADIWVSEKLAVKLQTQILSATRAIGGETYYGYWGPVYIPGYSTLWQFGLGGGLVFRLK